MNVIKISAIFLAAALTGSFISCSRQQRHTLTTEEARASGNTTKQISEANNRFAFEIYKHLEQNGGGNLFFSPYSIFSAFAMVYEGGRGETAIEIKSAFFFPEDKALREGFSQILRFINDSENNYELRTSNAVWPQKNYPIIEDYKERIKKYYGGEARNMDYINRPEESRKEINSFVKEKTGGIIEELFSKGAIGELTRMIITNAIYFKGNWDIEFDKSMTRDNYFHKTPDDRIKVPMMSMPSAAPSFNYAYLDELQILELPYKDREVSMVILLPRKDIHSLKDSLSFEQYNKWMEKMRMTNMESVSIPKFELKTDYSLKGVLKKLGVHEAFDEQKADFTKMARIKENDPNLFISEAVHQAYISVDEEGTEAAAATGVEVGITSIDMSKVFRADRPFIFLIREKESGCILFLGRVSDPS